MKKFAVIFILIMSAITIVPLMIFLISANDNGYEDSMLQKLLKELE